MSPKRGAPKERPMEKALKFTIEWVVSLEYVNAEEALERLRETGAATITDVVVTEVRY